MPNRNWMAFWTLFFIAGLALAQSDDTLASLGLSRRTAQEHVWNSLRGGSLSVPGSETLRKIPAERRAAIARWVGGFAKEFTQSPAFLALYTEYRQSTKPAPPEALTPMDQELKTQKEEIQKSIREMEEALRSMPADQREALKSALEVMREQLKELDNPQNPLLSQEMQDLQNQAHAANLEDHKARLAQWEKEYPPGPEKLIRRRLTEFLEASKDVDFAAQLAPGKDGKMVFARADYESKPPVWKLCYRAGKDAVEAARAVASQWLAEMPAPR